MDLLLVQPATQQLLSIALLVKTGLFKVFMLLASMQYAGLFP